MKHEALLDVARSGIMAPSADNQHVFQLEIGDTDIQLWPTREFSATTALHRRVLGLISLGAVVENMRLRAAELGLEVHVNWPATGGVEGPIVRMALQSNPTIAVDELAVAIPSRHTNRRMYSGPGLTESETGLLNAAVQSVEGIRLVWLHGAARRRALGLIWRAESERFLREQLHKEIFSSIRFDLPWNETANWALPPGALEIEKPMRPMFKALRHWTLMRPLTWAGVHNLIGMRAGWLPCWQAPALGLLATGLSVEAGGVAVGSALERLWLRATLLDLAFQPMAASAVLPLQSAADHGASENLRSDLIAGWQSITPGISPLMVFRIGRAGNPSVRTSRRSVEEHMGSGHSNSTG